MRVGRTPANARSGWPTRVARGLRLDRNPLRRGSDRAETALLGVLLAAFLAIAPFAAHAAGSWTYATSAGEAQAQQAALHQVPATLLQATTPWGFEGGAEVQARWRAPNGQMRTGQVFVAGSALAGSTVMVWTNQAGQVSDSPLQRSQVTGRADLARALAVAALAVTLLTVGLGGRWALDRRRLTAWDAEWLATEPRWSSRR